MQTDSVTIAGRTFPVSVVRMGELKRMPEAVRTIREMTKAPSGELPTAAEYDAMVRFVHAGAKAADPTLSFEEFSEFCDNEVGLMAGVKELAEALAVVAVGSGLERVAIGSAGAGEAAGPGATSTSADSTASLSPRPAGPSPTLTT